MNYLGCLDVEALDHYVNGYVFARVQAAVAATGLRKHARTTVMERFAAWLDPLAKYPAWVPAVRAKAAALGRTGESALVAIELFDRYLVENEGTSLSAVGASSKEALGSESVVHETFSGSEWLRPLLTRIRIRPGSHLPDPSDVKGLGWVVNTFAAGRDSTDYPSGRAELVVLDRFADWLVRTCFNDGPRDVRLLGWIGLIERRAADLGLLSLPLFFQLFHDFLLEKEGFEW